ncbi:hypothetical protein LTR08_003911 [Meristemomyces frigidus]|nr:hypothetical protein LTR08_003911 [Meristemomyces frigidus]
MHRWLARRPPLCLPTSAHRPAGVRGFHPRRTSPLDTRRDGHKPATASPKTARKPAPPPPPAPDSPQAVEARHLLRALLRECTYLPDSAARAWMRGHVLQRFHAYTFKAWAHRDDPAFAARLQSKLREARQAIGQLQRANEGERKPLLKVLLMAYGRTGKRRHELMLPLLPTAGPRKDQPDTAPSPDDETAATPPKPTTPRSRPPSAEQVNRGDWAPYAPHLTPQLLALLTSQLRTPPPHLTRAVLRRLQPRIAELNAWHQPMPRSRVKNQTRAWYADLLGKVHPPLPTAEWVRLRGLASGASAEAGVPRRGDLGLGVGGDGAAALERLVMFGQVDGAGVGGRHKHRVTARFMRRLWGQVFAQCPVMEWEGGEWRVTWGESALYGIEGVRERGLKGGEGRHDAGGLGAALLVASARGEGEMGGADGGVDGSVVGGGALEEGVEDDAGTDDEDSDDEDDLAA